MIYQHGLLGLRDIYRGGSFWQNKGGAKRIDHEGNSVERAGEKKSYVGSHKKDLVVCVSGGREVGAEGGAGCTPKK